MTFDSVSEALKNTEWKRKQERQARIDATARMIYAFDEHVVACTAYDAAEKLEEERERRIKKQEEAKP